MPRHGMPSSTWDHGQGFLLPFFYPCCAKSPVRAPMRTGTGSSGSRSPASKPCRGAAADRAARSMIATRSPARVHEALIKKTLGFSLVGHISRDAPAIEARENAGVCCAKAQTRPAENG